MGNVKINFAETQGKIKDMNSVNNGPLGDHDLKNHEFYAAARIPYARLHDSTFEWRHTVDVHEIFPNFDADENDPASYDFTLTDVYLDSIEKVGTKIFYRLGTTIEHEIKRYGSIPPKDFHKWARICEHIIRHENEGWADGFYRGIEYWEIWNEPDLLGHMCWTGTIGEYIELFDIAIRHLKKCFPNIKVGGPALTHIKRVEWWQEFIPYLKEKKPPMDFFSFHRYASTTEQFTRDIQIAKERMVEAGYGDVELILNEWNFLVAWEPRETLLHSYRTIHALKGAAFNIAVMIVCQDSPLDHLMYYDARHTCTEFNGLFDRISYEPLKPYYAFYAFSDLAELGTEVASSAEGEGIYALAAKSEDGGHGALLLTNYRNELTSIDGVGFAPETVKIEWKGLSDKPVRVTVRTLDNDHDLTETSTEVFGTGAGAHTLTLPLYASVVVNFDEL